MYRPTVYTDVSHEETVFVIMQKGRYIGSGDDSLLLLTTFSSMKECGPPLRMAGTRPKKNPKVPMHDLGYKQLYIG
jgi:hypothetical protein